MTDEIALEIADQELAEDMRTVKRGPGRPRGSKKKPVRAAPIRTAKRAMENRAAPAREETLRTEHRGVMSRGQRPQGRPIPQGLKRTARHEEDQFYIPYNLIPDGWSYEWKRESYAGQPDTRHMNNLKENHWEAVPQDRHPNFAVRNGGMILMERPAYVTEDALRASFDVANSAVQAVNLNINQAPEGQFTRQHPSVNRVAGIKRNYMMDISVGHDVDPKEAEERE